LYHLIGYFVFFFLFTLFWLFLHSCHEICRKTWGHLGVEVTHELLQHLGSMIRAVGAAGYDVAARM
jgi:hypothetical protein